MVLEEAKIWSAELERRKLLRTLFGSFIGAGLAGSLTAVARAALPGNLQKGMHAVITGSGSALPDPQRGNASAAVIVDGAMLQFDCGRKAMDNQMRAGIDPVDVDFIFFTHLHFDHIATYDYYLISSWIAGRQKPFKVFGPPGTRSMNEGALAMHGLDVRFVKAIVDSWPESMPRRPASRPPVEVTEIGAGEVLKTKQFRVTAVETAHFPKQWGWKSLGYRVDSRYGSVAISGDTAPTEKMVELAHGVDLLIHECVMPDYGMTRGGKFSLKMDTSKPRTGHTTPSELGRLAAKAKVGRLVATHLPPYTSVPAAREMSSMYYGPGEGPEIWDKFTRAIEAHYTGPVVLAQDAMVFSIG